MDENNNLLLYRLKGMDLVETFFHILDSIHEGVVVIDMDSIIIYVNPAYTRILCVPLEKIIGKRVYDIEPGAKTLHVLETGHPILGEYEVLRSIGKHAIFDSTGIFLNGQMVGVVSIFRDITDIIKINQKLEYYRNYAKKLTKQRWVSKEELPSSFRRITGNDPIFVQVLQLAAKVAPTEATVLLEGESGVGKELIAVAIHAAGHRGSKPFVAVNCAAIPEFLFESEMFGYEEGAFTGAKKTGKQGKFALANGGTLFLDEIGDLPLTMQAKLLRVLQEGQVERLGSTRLEPVNVRIIAATNNNIDTMVEQGKFRQDLYFRLNVINIKIPPLRERLDDIRLLADEFLKSSNRPDLKLSLEVINAFHKYHWSGNVRELENVLRHAAIVCQENEVTLPDLPAYFHEQMLKSVELENNEGETVEEMEYRLEKFVADAEKRAILKALEKCGNNRSRAMRILGLSRGTFYNKLKKHGI